MTARVVVVYVTAKALQQTRRGGAPSSVQLGVLCDHVAGAIARDPTLELVVLAQYANAAQVLRSFLQALGVSARAMPLGAAGVVVLDEDVDEATLIRLAHEYGAEAVALLTSPSDEPFGASVSSPANVRFRIFQTEIGTPTVVDQLLNASPPTANIVTDVDSDSTVSVEEMATKARAASRVLRALPSESRSFLLHRIADALVARESDILEANALDLAASQDTLSPAMFQRLILDAKKLAVLAAGIRQMADSPEPIGRVLRRMELADGLILEQKTVPLGVVLIIFESRPDALPQVASIALRSGNAILLKGGKEARHSNQILHKIIADTVAASGLDAAVVGLLQRRESIDKLLAMREHIDLVVPRGSDALVRYIQDHTKIPVLGHAEGICHVFVDSRVDDIHQAARIVVDSKTDYPAACNAMETLLLHRQLVDDGRAATIIDALVAAGVQLHGGPNAMLAFPSFTPTTDFRREFGSLAATVEIVNSVDEAVVHINQYGSAHTDCIISDNEGSVATFLARVDSACVFHNASTRFADGYRFGLGAELGISTGRIHARGPVGVDGLLTTQWVLRGHGDVVQDFSGGRRSLAHRPLPVNSAS